MSIFNKIDAYNATCLKIENKFNTEIKDQISNKIREAINDGKFTIYLDIDYNKYYLYIKKYFKKEKHYHVHYWYSDYEPKGFIEISWD